MKYGLKEELIRYFNADLLVWYGNMKQDAKDIDLLIVSDIFIGISILKRKLLVRSIDSSIDPVCFTTFQFEQFKRNNSSLYQSILLNHIVLHGNPTNIF